MKTIRGNLVDIYSEEIYPAAISFENGQIKTIEKIKTKVENYILTGFIDAHIHIESSMVTPVEFSRTAIRHGTIGAVTDPHEIANVLGKEGVQFMIENASRTPMKFLFGAPSCVPATNFESSGAVIDAVEVGELLKMKKVGFLSEMMNYPGVIFDDKEVHAKIAAAKLEGLPIDGHAPGLRGEDLKKYAESGISTDHECFSYEEAVEKIERGMKILIREGSGAKNFHALIPLLKAYPDKIMFCSDDLHPDDLMEGHINLLVKKALDLGYNIYDVLKAGGFHAREHYSIPVGMLREGEPADFVIVDSLDEMNILSTYINGEALFENETVHIQQVKTDAPNKFNIEKLKDGDIDLDGEGEYINVIQAIDGELITKKIVTKAKIVKGKVQADLKNDVLKIAVVNRYEQSTPALGFINGFNLKYGAIASSIGHDSHNIICIGCEDDDMIDTINWVIHNKGGIALKDHNEVKGLALEIAGIMSLETVEDAADKYQKLSSQLGTMGCTMRAPFMTLAFMALLVIPELKMSDKGLFDGKNFSFTSVFTQKT